MKFKYILMELEIKNEKFGLLAVCPVSKNQHLFASGATTINKDQEPFLKIFLFDTTDKKEPISNKLLKLRACNFDQSLIIFYFYRLGKIRGRNPRFAIRDYCRRTY
jgi:hypothetical protein